MRPRTWCLLFVLLAGTSARADVTGVWSGTYTLTIRCDSGGSLTSSGTAGASLIESAGNFVGFVHAFMVNIPGENCAQMAQLPISLLVSGTVSGNAVTGTVTAPGPEEIDFTGTLSGTSLSASFNGAGSSGTFTVSQTSTIPPPTVFSGTYMGTYSSQEDVRDRCSNMQTLSFGGPLDVSLFHAGRGLAGIVVLNQTKDVRSDAGVCTVIDSGSEVVPFSATVTDGQFVGFAGADEIEVVTGTISPTSITGMAEGISFNAIKTGGTPPPTITSFRANPEQIERGATSTLSWSTINAANVVIDRGVGEQPASGSVIVRPLVSTVYTLTARGPGGIDMAKTAVTVVVPAAPHVVLSSPPPGFVQRAGQGGGRDAFTLSNIGGAPAAVTLVPANGFFTVSRRAVDIPARSSQRFEVVGTPQQPGFFAGTIALSGAGVREGAAIPVRMFSASPAAGSVRPRPKLSRAELSSESGQTISGVIEFTNSGSAPLQTMVTSDVPWVTPESDLITIGPGETRGISITVEPSKRSEGEGTIGAAYGKLSLVFIGDDGGNGASPSIMGSGGTTSTVSVTLVHVVRPGVAPGAPPALGPGELALFVPGVANKPTASGDLFVSNTQATAVSDLKLYLLSSSGASQSASLPTLQSSGALALPSLVKNVFGGFVVSGTTQVRSASISNVSVAATQTNASSAVGTYSTALPVFRSDRGASSGAQIFLSGLSKTAGDKSNLFVQELSGTAGTFQVEFLGGNGEVLSTLSSQTVTPFGFVELADAAPTGTASARITNSSAAKLAAYGLVENGSTGDAWLSSDPAAEDPAATTYVIPLLSEGTDAQTTLHLTNRGASTAEVTIDVLAPLAGKRRAAGKGSASPPPMQRATSSVPLAPSQTTATPISQQSGYVRLTVPAGAISAAARSVRTTGTESFGTGLPAVPTTFALAAGEMRRFAGVEDASPASRAAAVPATYRTSLALVETSGESVRARVTLAYTFAAGSLASAQAVSSKEYSLSASQFLLINDVARDVIGPQRDSFGDLRNMTLDVEIVEGSGGVLPFLQAIDNGSGDSLVRTE